MGFFLFFSDNFSCTSTTGAGAAGDVAGTAASFGFLAATGVPGSLGIRPYRQTAFEMHTIDQKS